ncbi:MAG: T9SS type A sorting domain-containing protein, partial [Bacteroidetes bacterium]|nr:T9SS type A sorting domain-containing protein [Bacteroidota bacterium]
TWAGPNGFYSSALNPSVSLPGMYYLTVTHPNGCSATDSVLVDTNFVLPIADAGQNVILDCNNTTLTLDGSNSSPGIYHWSGPNGFSSNLISPIVSDSGLYTLSVTGTNGCIGTDVVSVSGNFDIPSVNAGPNQIIDCNNPTVTLDGSNSDPGAYYWSGPNGFSSNLVNPIVSDSGLYTLSVTGTNGCTGTAQVSVSGDFSPPITEAGFTQELNCNYPSVILDGSDSDPGIYTWTGPNGFTSNLVSPSVSLSGIYILTIIGTNGCTGTDWVYVSSNFSVPTVSAGPDQVINCNTPSATLNSSSSDPGTYSWTGPNGFISNLINPIYSGIYTLTVTGTNGCAGSASVDVKSDFTIPNANAGNFQTINCNNPTVMLDGSFSDPGVYTWTGPNGFLSSLISPIVADTGVYMLMVTGGNGCTGFDSTFVEQDFDSPIANAGPDKILYSNSLGVYLQGLADPLDTIKWAGPNGFTSSNLTPLVSYIGTYILTVTGINGCISVDSTIVTAGNIISQEKITIPIEIEEDTPKVVIDLVHSSNNDSIESPNDHLPHLNPGLIIRGNHDGTAAEIQTSLTTLNVFPNPFTKKELTLDFSGDFGETLYISVYTTTGQLIYHEERPFAKRVKLDLSELTLAEGIYKIRVNDKTKLVHYLFHLD